LDRRKAVAVLAADWSAMCDACCATAANVTRLLALETRSGSVRSPKPC
jgi:hypothetical protein